MYKTLNFYSWNCKKRIAWFEQGPFCPFFFGQPLELCSLTRSLNVMRTVTMLLLLLLTLPRIITSFPTLSLSAPSRPPPSVRLSVSARCGGEVGAARPQNTGHQPPKMSSLAGEIVCPGLPSSSSLSSSSPLVSLRHPLLLRLHLLPPCSHPHYKNYALSPSTSVHWLPSDNHHFQHPNHNSTLSTATASHNNNNKHTNTNHFIVNSSTTHVTLNNDSRWSARPTTTTPTTATAANALTSSPPTTTTTTCLSSPPARETWPCPPTAPARSRPPPAVAERAGHHDDHHGLLPLH